MSENREVPTGRSETLDLLHGAGAIAAFMNMSAPQFYHLRARAKQPTFKLPGGSTICARRTKLTAWLVECEAKARQQGKAPLTTLSNLNRDVEGSR